jgi:hypothetical protein
LRSGGCHQSLRGACAFRNRRQSFKIDRYGGNITRTQERVADVSLYNIYYATHGKDTVRVGHDEILRYYMSLDGKKWTPVDDHTQKSALNDAHARLHVGERLCDNKLNWKLIPGSRASVLGECPKCQNPSLLSDLKTYRRCPDCGWRIDFTKEEIDWVENKLNKR